MIYAVSRDGVVTAMSEKHDERLWQVPTAGPVNEPPAVIDGRVYVTTRLGALFCLDAKTGKRFWKAPKCGGFWLRAGNGYTRSIEWGGPSVLDAKSGALLDILPTENLPIRLLNTETDRLYLATDTGLVQCLHENRVDQAAAAPG